jgi:hypothetical protein
MTGNVTSGKEIQIALHQILRALLSQVNYYFALNVECFIMQSKLLRGPSFKSKTNFSKTNSHAIGVACSEYNFKNDKGNIDIVNVVCYYLLCCYLKSVLHTFYHVIHILYHVVAACNKKPAGVESKQYRFNRVSYPYKYVYFACGEVSTSCHVDQFLVWLVVFCPTRRLVSCSGVSCSGYCPLCILQYFSTKKIVMVVLIELIKTAENPTSCCSE